MILALTLIACDVNDLLDVPDPDVATPTTIESKDALPAVLASAQADYMVAYDGNVSTNLVTGVGLITDELIHAETFPTRLEFDIRNIQATTNTDLQTLYRNLHRARISAKRAATAYVKFDTTQLGWAESLILEGMTYVNFGESFCNGVPFSELTQADSVIYGDPITNDSMFALAIVRFDSAITAIGFKDTAAAAASARTLRNFARVAKARALLDRGQAAAAATVLAAEVGPPARAAVPDNFAYTINHSENTTRQNNGTFALIYDGRRFAVGNSEGTNGLPFRTDGDTAAAVRDPRIRNGRGTGVAAFGFDGATPLFQEKKYPVRSSPIVVADGIEARLIEAEANLQTAAGGSGTWLATLNTLRTNAGMAGNLVNQGSQTANENLFFKERAYWLWLTGHRLSDMRRLIRQYGRAPTAVFPTGAYPKGNVYGGDVNFPIYFDEKNNPKVTAGPATGFCIDRDP